jgi:acetoin utilization deacetylase AcuC-like enzyme
MASSGFCLLNTVAVAAAYAMYRYGREPITAQHAEGSESSSESSCRCSKSGPFRIAIIDIDVHHGNGTEEIVRNLRCSLRNGFLYQLCCLHAK